MAAARAIWIDEGNDADYERLRRHGIFSPCYSIRDPRVTKPYLIEVRERGFSPGIYAAWNWFPELSGKGFARALSDALGRIAPNSAPGFPFVCADIETHSVAYLRDFLAEWRRLRRDRETDWTLEGYQGGLYSPEDVAAIEAADVRVCPQTYTGSMQPFDAVEVALDLTQGAWRDFPRERIRLMYDAAHLPVNWQGSAFTQGRLPS